MIWPRLALILLVVILAAGCALERDPGPPRLRYGEIVCAECGMLVSEPRFAAAARSPSGEVRAFDDLGCLLRHAGRAGLREWRLWAPTEPDGAWIDARSAAFVRREDLATPMGYGFTAVAASADDPTAAMTLTAAIQAALAASSQPQGGPP
jgi:copper chaperone NosL